MSKLADCFHISDGILDLTKSKNHPLQLRYSEIFKEALIKVKIKDGRVNPSGTLLSHPIVLALNNLETIEKSNWYEHIYLSLYDFYKNFSPKSISEWFNISIKNKQAHNKEAYYSVLPWRARSVQGFGDVIVNNIKKEALDAGFKACLEFGWTYAGPVSTDKIKAETKRFISIYESILINGYSRNSSEDGDIKITALIDNNKDWRWFPTSGIHRCYVLTALGYTEFIARVNLIIVEDEVDYYPHVVDGFYTKTEALKIFNQIFHG